jgi:hypothetical protein
MPKFIDLYRAALEKYIEQAERAHHSLVDNPDKRIFIFGFFSGWRHSLKQYPALLDLRARLESDSSADQVMAMTAIKAHFADENNKWNNHSFNNYLLDEIKKNASAAEWSLNWKEYDKAPIEYYRGILFRGAGTPPASAFKNGMAEETSSVSIDSYIKDMNGAIGVSTSKDFGIAHAYALPQIRANRDFEFVRSEAYIYVMDYQGSVGLDLQQTFLARGKKIAAYLSGNKAEVNIIGRIPPEHIIGAFYVNRKEEIIWHPNPNFQRNNSEDITQGLAGLVPRKFLQKIAEKTAATIQATKKIVSISNRA